MAARDAEFNIFLKEALKNKLRYPGATSFRLGKYFLDYDFIFQEARRVLPQKYSIGHSYWKHDNQRIPISYLNKQQLNELNLEFAREVIASWGGFEEAPTDQRYLDPVLVEYENELTAPEEPDSFHEEIERHQLPQDQEEEQAQQGPEEDQGAPPPSGGQSQQPPPRVVVREPQTNKERFWTKENYAKYKEENKEARDLRARQLWDRRKRAGMNKEQYAQYKQDNQDERKERAKELWDRRKAGMLKPKPAVGGWNPLGDWLSKKIGQRLAQSRFVQPALKALEGLAERLGLSPVLNGLKALNNLLGWPERLLGRLAGQLGREALNLGFNIGRSVLGGLANGAGAFLEGAATVTGIITGIGSALVATGAGALLLGVTLFITIMLGIVWLYDTYLHNLECSKPQGNMIVNKRFVGGTSSSEGVNNGERIDYIIEMSYDLACQSRKLETVEVTDKIPSGTKLVTAEEDSTRKPRSGFYGGFGSGGDTGPDGIYDPATDTLTWTFTNFPTQNPVYIYFSVIPGEEANDSWVMNQATVKYTVLGAVSAGGGYPPTLDNCNGAYQLNNPVGNFGDPLCDFKKDDLYTQLQQQDPRNADFWFYQVVRCESSYSPNSYRDPNTIPRTPDAAGAWGLFQMGRGKNGQYDHGDVPWQQQIFNAVNYAKLIPSIGAYWATARGHSC